MKEVNLYRICLGKYIAEFSVGRKIMKLPFPSYQTTFTCDCTMQEAITRIQGCVLQNKKEMKIKKAEFNGVQTFVIETSTGSIFYNNSF